MTLMEGKRIIEQKVSDFAGHEKEYLSKTFQETETRTRFINPFFTALGWSFDQTQTHRSFWDVHQEFSQRDHSGTKKPDYAFRIDQKIKFFVEAKAPWVPLTDKDPVFQAKRYAFSTAGKAPIVILTDFQEFRVFNALQRPIYDNPLQGLIKELDLTYTQYIEKWDFIYSIFSKEAIQDGSLSAYIGKTPKNTKSLDDEFLDDIIRYREILAKNIALRNRDLSVSDINEAVQRILDRLVFIRNLEDKGIEEEDGLLNLVMTKDDDSAHIYKTIVPLFRRLDSQYNGLLFKKHFSETLELDNKTIKEIVRNLCFPLSPFQFDIIEPEILGRIYERFLGSKIRLTEDHHAKVEEKPEVRKAGGVYYTPQYIVDYIVQNTVGEKIKDKTPEEIAEIRICDPACGSGSFLLGAYNYLLDYHKSWYKTNGKNRKYKDDFYLTPEGDILLTLKKRGEILSNNIFGVDIDREATEVAMMSLYLKLLEDGFDKGEAMLFMKGHILPTMESNIKCGNSLIGSDFYADKDLSLFASEELKQVNAFDWEKEFAEIFASETSEFVHLTFTTKYSRKKIEGKEPVILSDEERQIVSEQIESASLKLGFKILTTAVLPDHTHLLAAVMNTTVSEIAKQIKGASAHSINALRGITAEGEGRAGHIWAEDYSETFVKDEEQLMNTIRYIDGQYDKHRETWGEIHNVKLTATPDLSRGLQSGKRKLDYQEYQIKDGFDVVIGNPPYVFTRGDGFSEIDKQYFNKKYNHQAYQLNTYSLFIEQAYILLKIHGFLGFIIPNNWLTISSMKMFRDFILNNTGDLIIVNMLFKVFHGVNVDTSILRFNKQSLSKIINLFESDSIGNYNLIRGIDKNSLINQEIIQINLYKNQIYFDIIKKIEDTSSPLKFIATVSTGLKVYQTGKGTPPQKDYDKNNRIYHSTIKKDDSYKQYLDGKDVQRYFLGWSGEYLRYGDFLAEPRKSVPFSNNRLLIRQIPSKLPYSINAVFTNQECLNDINSMVVFNNLEYALLYILGFLNSKLTSFWFDKKYDKMQRNIFPQFKVKELSDFPICTLDLSNLADKAKHDKMVSLVDYMLAAQKKIREARTDTDKEMYRRQAERIDGQIDGLVYELYGLSNEEIKVVEGKE